VTELVKPTGVCAIGASAGGLEPVADLIEHLPADLGIAVVIAQHLSPDHESRMVRLLKPRTPMPLAELSDGAALEPNHVYVLAPGQMATIDDTKVIIEDRPRADPDNFVANRPIDALFGSIATWGSKACAVILSGTGDDGTQGSGQVSDRGGLTLVQDDTALFGDMPTSAQNSGSVDASGNAAELAQHITRYFLEGQRPTNADRFGAVEVALLGQLEAVTGVNFEDYKRGTVRRRMEHRMRVAGVNSIDALTARVAASRLEAEALAEDILIGVTSFFRNPDSFDHLATAVLPDIVEAASANDEPVRCWTAGCATGQEAYTLAMLLIEVRDRIDPKVPIKIFATDVHEGALAVARDALYSESDLEGVNPERRERFFRHEPGGWRVRPEVRGLIAFSNHNMLTDAPFTYIDLMLCRNALIYFTQRAQRSALWAFGFALRSGGHIMLGESESLGVAAPDFSPIAEAPGVYRKERNEATHGLRRTRRAPEFVRPRAVMGRPQSLGSAGGLPSPGELAKATNRAHEVIYRTEGIGALLLDESRNLHQIIGQAVDWLEFSPGTPPSDATRLIHDIALRTAVTAMMKELDGGQSTTSRSVSVDFGTGHTMLDLTANRIEYSGFVFTLIHGRPASAVISLDETSSDSDAGQERARIALLEKELATTRSQLSAAVEHQEASQQDLLSTNEELMVANEELQTSIEELSSTNEELRTVADENELRLRDVLALGADLEQVLEATDIGVLLLNSDGTIRRFSEACDKFFHILPTDIGRPIDHIRPQFSFDELAEAIEAGIQDRRQAQLRIDVTRPTRRALLLNVIPYTLVGDEAGVSVTIIDITSAQERENELLDLNRRLHAFTEMASHDLKAPLRSIRSYAELLEEDNPDLDPAFRDTLAVIAERAQALDRLVDTLADYSRSTPQRTSSSFTLEALMDDTFAQISVRPAEGELAVRDRLLLDLHDERISTDRVALSISLRNLLDNAVRLAADPSHRISVTGRVVEASEHRRGIDHAGPTLHVVVAEEGPSVDPAKQERLFQPFRRLTDEVSGLGLATTDNIVAEHRGSLELLWSPGTGSTFTMTWPLDSNSGDTETDTA
jgi:two-component system CheB/CheR fusion protein